MTGVLRGNPPARSGPPVPADPPSLAVRAAGAGLAVLATASWPERPGEPLPQLAGFIHSTFNPLVAAAADRCLTRRPSPKGAGDTAVVVVSALGDVASAAHVASMVDEGGRVGPLFFFQSVPNAVAGYVA